VIDDIYAANSKGALAFTVLFVVFFGILKSDKEGAGLV